MKKRLAALLLGFTLLSTFTGFSCNPTNTRPRLKVPGAPELLEVRLTTWQDRYPCVAVTFSDTNTMEVSFALYKSGPNDNAFRPLVRNIPPAERIVRDLDLPYAYLTDYDGYAYQARAISRQDSLSPPSNTLTLYLIDTPPIIDSVVRRAGHPVVHYTFPEQSWGLDYALDITKNDSVIASFLRQGVLFTAIQHASHTFSELSIDSLYQAARADPADNGIYGVRLSVLVPTTSGDAHGIAADTFNVLIP